MRTYHAEQNRGMLGMPEDYGDSQHDSLRPSHEGSLAENKRFWKVF